MDLWKFFDITHRECVFCNPMSVVKFEELIALLRLGPQDRVLEIATGKAEFIIRLAERYGIGGCGVDISPFCVADAKEKHQRRAAAADLRFIEQDGAAYTAQADETFAAVTCIGASWIYGGHQATLKALIGMAAPGAWIVVGEPYWRQEPASAFLEASGHQRSDFGTHHDNMTTGLDLGLELVYTLVSNQDDWDRYNGLQWYAADSWARANQDDPDRDEVLRRVRNERDQYLRWGRETFGWAVYLFRNTAPTEG